MLQAVFNTHNNTITIRLQEGNVSHLEYPIEDERVIQLKDGTDKTIGILFRDIETIVATHNQEAPIL